MTEPGFGTSLRRDAGEPRHLGARLDAQLRERLEEAVDLACLDGLVHARRARGLPAPRPDSRRDRDEFAATVRALLARLCAELGAPVDRDRPAASDAGDAAARGRAGDAGEVGRLIAAQVTLARALPDYWQRFEAIRVAYVAELASSENADGRPSGRGRSGGQRRGLLARLLGRG